MRVSEIKKVKDPIAQTAITLRTTCAAVDLLEQLRDTGLYGRSVEDVAERLLCERLRQLAFDDSVRA